MGRARQTGLGGAPEDTLQIVPRRFGCVSRPPSFLTSSDTAKGRVRVREDPRWAKHNERQYESILRSLSPSTTHLISIMFGASGGRRTPSSRRPFATFLGSPRPYKQFGKQNFYFEICDAQNYPRAWGDRLLRCCYLCPTFFGGLLSHYPLLHKTS